MIKLIVTYNCKPGEREPFFNAIKAEGLDQACRDEEGNHRYAYAFAAEDKDRMYLLEAWENNEILSIHKEMTHFKRIGELKEQYVLETVVEMFED